jgi:thiol-disulfide isomerase/thioredoxin
MKKAFSLFFFLLAYTGLNAQSIQATLPNMANQIIELKGFYGFKTLVLSQTKVAGNGKLEIQFDSNQYGLAFLQSHGSAPFFVILNKEGCILKGKTLLLPEEIEVIEGNENKILNGNLDLLDSLAFEKLTQKNYLYSIFELKTAEAKKIEAFRKIDFTESIVFKSGFLPSLLEKHFLYLQTSEEPKEWIEQETKTSINLLLKNFEKNEKHYNQLVDFLFNLFENMSCYAASEYLAIRVLEQNTCSINPFLADNLESYRKMKIGNKAPNIQFKHGLKINGEDAYSIKSLFDITTNYTLLIFGTSWCSKCKEEMPALLKNYTSWKEKNMEIVYIALDVDLEQHTQYSKNFPFVVSCMCKLGEQEAANDYFVRSTPSMFLLNAQHEIVLRPFSVQQIELWMDSNFK